MSVGLAYGVVCLRVAVGSGTDQTLSFVVARMPSVK